VLNIVSIAIAADVPEPTARDPWDDPCRAWLAIRQVSAGNHHHKGRARAGGPLDLECAKLGRQRAPQRIDGSDSVCDGIGMSTRQSFLAKVTGSQQHIRGLDDERWEGYPGAPTVFFDITSTTEEERLEMSDQLDDILSEMSSAAFSGDDHAWTNDDFAPIAVLGGATDEDAPFEPTYPFGFQVEAFLFHSNATGAVHLFEIKPKTTDEFEGLPVVSPSLDELRTRLASLPGASA